MTVITITAVGYHEDHPLSQAGRYWTTFVLAGGLTGLANHVVSPNVAGAVWVASVLVRPAVASFLDVTAPGSHLSRHLDHATVGAGSQVAGCTLAKARILDATGLLVVAVRKRGTPPEEVLLNPPGDTVLEPGDDVIVLGDEEQAGRLREYVG